MLSSSFTWWDKSKPGSAPTSPAVVTRLIPVAVPKAPIPVQALDSPQISLKRKRAEQERKQKKKSRASSTESSTPPPVPPTARSRKRMSKTSGARPSPTPSSSRASASARPSPPITEPIYRHSRSRSASVLRASEEPTPRDCYLEADAGQEGDLLTCEKVFREYQKSYKTHFMDPDNPGDTSWEPHETNYPVAELEFPNTGATERYILLAPKDKDHYSPMLCLERALHAIVECYMTPEQQALFGPMPTATSTPEEETPHANHLRTLHRAVVKKNGPLFLSALAAINKLLQSLKYPPLPDDPFAPALPNALKETVRNWTPTGLPWRVAQRIIEETYQRTVGPRSDELRNYEAFSSTTYGELMPSLVAQILKQTRLKPGMLFLDLGSGVGNVVLQAALQCGCDSFGIEIKAGPAELARDQHKQLLMRAAMWGVNVGNVELAEGDMLENGRVNELLRKADVVLVNNKVFDESLNAALRPKFLDLKDGAIVISLRPFVQPNARMTERNIDDISTIFDVTQHEYHSMDVSWDCKGGSYYIHRVDRAGYAAILAQFQLASSRSSRGRR